MTPEPLNQYTKICRDIIKSSSAKLVILLYYQLKYYGFFGNIATFSAYKTRTTHVLSFIDNIGDLVPSVAVFWSR